MHHGIVHEDLASLERKRIRCKEDAARPKKRAHHRAAHLFEAREDHLSHAENQPDPIAKGAREEKSAKERKWIADAEGLPRDHQLARHDHHEDRAMCRRHKEPSGEGEIERTHLRIKKQGAVHVDRKRDFLCRLREELVGDHPGREEAKKRHPTRRRTIDKRKNQIKAEDPDNRFDERPEVSELILAKARAGLPERERPDHIELPVERLDHLPRGASKTSALSCQPSGPSQASFSLTPSRLSTMSRRQRRSLAAKYGAPAITWTSLCESVPSPSSVPSCSRMIASASLVGTLLGPTERGYQGSGGGVLPQPKRIARKRGATLMIECL